MMNLLRKNLLKHFFGLAVLCLLALKFLTFSISTIMSCGSAYAIEKSSEENKDKEGESFDKVKKKLLVYQSFNAECPNLLTAGRSQLNTYAYGIRICSAPARNVPTPPPNC